MHTRKRIFLTSQRTKWLAMLMELRLCGGKREKISYPAAFSMSSKVVFVFCIYNFIRQGAVGLVSTL